MAKDVPFTPRTLANLKPGAARYEVREAGRTGLRLRVEPSGVKSFRWPCTSLGKVFTLGRFGDGSAGTLTLADARRALDVHKAQHSAGLDPEGVDRAERPRTVKDLAGVWYRESILLRRRRPEEVEDVIDREIVPTIGRVPLVAVDALVAGRPVSRTVARGARVHAARVLQLTKQMFTFAAARGFVTTNPAASLRADDFGIVASSRDRHLSVDEIPLVLAGVEAGAIGPTLRHGLVLLFFAGLRTNEALTLEWTDVDLDAATVTIRPENQKVTAKRLRSGKVKPYIVPLSTPALAAVKALRELAPESSRWVFYSPPPRAKLGRVEGSSLGNALRRIVARDKRLAKIPKFSPHIFRHTLATHMTETLRLAPWLGQLCLGHSLNSMLGSSVADRYDQAQLLGDRREALEAYATWVEGLRTGKTAQVIPMVEGGAR